MILCYGVGLAKVLITNNCSFNSFTVLTSPIPEHDLLEFKFHGDQNLFWKDMCCGSFLSNLLTNMCDV